MKLQSLGLLNWANLENLDYQFGEVNLITGDSGAGKTTLLDAIQTIMTGAMPGLYQYNPGQEETTQQSRTKETRTLASYILGCDDGSYARPCPSYGYIIANWAPEMGERAEPFSAVIGVSAYLDTAGNKRTAKEDDLFMAIARTTALGVEQFQHEDENGRKHIVALKELPRHLNRIRPELHLEIARNKEDYLCMLFGAFRNLRHVSRIEARNAAKSVAKFMVYKPIKNLDVFVRQEILEPQDFSDAIRQVSGMMRNINGMEQEAKNLVRGIDLLRSADAALRAFIKTAIEEQLAQYEHLDREAGKIQETYQAVTDKQQTYVSEKVRQEQEKDTLESKLHLASERLSTLKNKRKGFDVLIFKDKLEGRLDHLSAEQAKHAVSLLDSNTVRAANRAAALTLQQALNREQGWLETTEAATWETLLTRILSTDSWDKRSPDQMVSRADLDNLRVMKREATDIEKAHNALARQLSRDADSIGERLYKARNTAGANEDKVNLLKREMAQLKNANAISYPPHIRKALGLIARVYPDADARVLCDHIEVMDDAWQQAIEGLLGNNRFLIVVNPDFESRAIALIEENGLHKSAVIQGKKATLDAQKLRLSPESIVHLMRFSHHLVEYYFKASYGTVQQVGDAESLRTTRRGLMKNGMASGNYKLFLTAMAETDLVFGSDARLRALKAKSDQLEQLIQYLESCQAQLVFFQTWHDAAKRIGSITLSHAITGLIRLEEEKKDIARQLADLDLSETREIDTEIRQATEEIRELSEENNRVNQRIGSLRSKIENNSELLEGLDAERALKIEAGGENEEILARYSENWPALAVSLELERIVQNRGSITPRHAFDGVNFGGQLNHDVKTAETALDEFNRIRIRGRNIDTGFFSELNITREHSAENRIRCFAFACDVCRQVDMSLNFLRNDILAKHQEKLTEMTQQFNAVFVTHICHTLYNAIHDGQARLDSLNRKLRNHMFGEEYYQFEYEWIPEYRDYIRFFKEATAVSLEDDSPLFGASTLTDDSNRIYNEIRARLLDDDIERSLRDLKRITDYRNYRTYDIKKCYPDRELSMKKYGTGSGGQMETPSYVIRSASLASALRYGEGYSHLRMVMIDESFSKMDEHRCRAVLDYLSNKLGLQILFVVPSKSAGVLHDAIDRLFQVTKLRAIAPRGELNTCVMLNTSIMKKDPVSELWNRERLAIEGSARQLDFLDLLDDPGPANTKQLPADSG